MSAEPIIKPATAADCTEEWIALRRDTLARCRIPARAGKGNTIELCSLTPVEQLAEHDRLKMNPWVPMILPGGAACFATEGDRDAVLHQLMR